MNGKLMYYVDQYGRGVHASTVKELQLKVGGRVAKMYIDTSSGVKHVGYVVGSSWFKMYAAVEIDA